MVGDVLRFYFDFTYRKHNLLFLKGYILSDPVFVPTARSCWIGSKATAVG